MSGLTTIHAPWSYCCACAEQEMWDQARTAALESAWYVTVSDPEIGRNDRLWPALDSWINERKSGS